MRTETDLTVPSHPTLRTLGKTTAIAALVASALLVTIVLPAEYAVDPLGTGRVLGLTAIADPPLTPFELPTAEGQPMAPTVVGPVGEYPGAFQFDAYEVVLQPYEYVEYKYRLETGAHMVFSWKADAPVVQDFHGERAAPGGADAAEESYDKRDRARAAGSFTAPFAGIHGWYWENPTNRPVSIRLNSSGFYTAALEIRSDRTRTLRELKPADALTLVRAPGQP